MKFWQDYSEKFLQITPREQMLILLTGLVLILFGLFNFVVEGQIIQIRAATKEFNSLQSSNNQAKTIITALETAVKKDPNKAINEKISQYKTKLASVDKQLLALTSDLIDPIQMRHALIEILQLDRGVKLASFELVGAVPVVLSEPKENNGEETEELSTSDVESLALYRHGIRLTLSGSYFKLRDYLQHLEQLQWKFFWQEFNYQMKEYPTSELKIEIYSLSTMQEFIGV